MTLSQKSNTVVIIPAYNAEKHLETLLNQTTSFTKNIILVDDGSTDGSYQIYSRFPIFYIRLKQNKGKGNALKIGFENAIKQGYKFAITMDADLQHPPSDLKKFIKRHTATKANLIYGKRDFSLKYMPPARILSNFLTSLIVSIKIKRPIYDSQCGYRLYDLNIIKKMDLTTTLYQTETELILKFAENDAKFDFIPIKTVYNDEKSYISHLRDIKNFVKLILNN